MESVDLPVSPPSASAQTLELFDVLGCAFMCSLSLALIAYLRHQQSGARKGDTDAARKIILPAFEPLLWVLAGATGIFTVALVALLAMDAFRTGTSMLARECLYCGHQFVFLLVMVFMHQKSVSIPALRRCVVVSLALATYTLPFVAYCSYAHDLSSLNDNTTTTNDDPAVYFAIQRVLRLLIVGWYLYIVVSPPSRGNPRTIRELSAFTVMYQVLNFASLELLRTNNTSEAGQILAYAALVWAALCPLVVWRVLRADTEHWRGLGQRACALQDVFRHKHQIHEHVSSQGLHVLIEMHRKLLIDFAHLDLRTKIGVGSSAVIFQGVLHSHTPIAAKVYTPMALSDEVVASFSHEAALCGALHHPNVVTFYGMCVLPPTICLVFELCQGSLEDVLLTNQRRKRRHGTTRQQFCIDIGYMIDAARAVAYLHSFSPGFLHRDVKPANFLVDAEHNVKLTDFGESRSLAILGASGVSVAEDGKQSRASIQGTTMPSPSPAVLEFREPAARQMTVRGTVDYMAPELIQGRGGLACYGEAADVYSLAMTMWDILYPDKERYQENSHLHVFQAVLDGRRPELSSDLHPTLQMLISSAWQVNALNRPSAQAVVAILEIIQEEVAAELLADCFSDDCSWQGIALNIDGGDGRQPTESSQSSESTLATKVTFCGSEAVEMMRGNHYVDSVGEAMRMGRMWMDAGLVHHVKHEQGFANDDTRYYLDEEQVRLCRQQIGEIDTTDDAWSSSDEQLPVRQSSYVRRNTKSTISSKARQTQTSDSNSTTATTACACRQHAQRQIGSVKPTVRRHRFRRKKNHMIAEEKLLTVSLLEAAATHS